MTAAVSGTSACPAPGLMTCCPASDHPRPHPPNLSFIFVLMINRASLQKLLTCPVIFSLSRPDTNLCVYWFVFIL